MNPSTNIRLYKTDCCPIFILDYGLASLKYVLASISLDSIFIKWHLYGPQVNELSVLICNFTEINHVQTTWAIVLPNEAQHVYNLQKKKKLVVNNNIQRHHQQDA